MQPHLSRRKRLRTKHSKQGRCCKQENSGNYPRFIHIQGDEGQLSQQQAERCGADVWNNAHFSDCLLFAPFCGCWRWNSRVDLPLVPDKPSLLHLVKVCFDCPALRVDLLSKVKPKSMDEILLRAVVVGGVVVVVVVR
jgi:hypothetical protein